MTRRDNTDREGARQEMVRNEIAGRGIKDQRVLDAMSTVRRERFVGLGHTGAAYDDRPLPIGAGQTISQPYIVALMAEAAAIGPDDRVLEIGTGSGYGAAVLRCLAREVWTIERIPELVERARSTLESEGFDRVHVVEGDGTLGVPEAAPFDAIIVTAAGPRVPRALCHQLVEGGRLIIPVGSERNGQELMRVRRRAEEYPEEALGAVRFVPLIGAEGWRTSFGDV